MPSTTGRIVHFWYVFLPVFDPYGIIGSELRALFNKEFWLSTPCAIDCPIWVEK